MNHNERTKGWVDFSEYPKETHKKLAKFIISYAKCFNLHTANINKNCDNIGIEIYEDNEIWFDYGYTPEHEENKLTKVSLETFVKWIEYLGTKKQQPEPCDPTKWPVGSLVILWSSGKPHMGNTGVLCIFLTIGIIKGLNEAWLVNHGYSCLHAARADGEHQYRLWTPYPDWKDHREEV
ncbi:MAG TPA: hypothetical protein VLE21_05195 [Candidatus Nitrosocosmicus sp.]|nr:hypothetical protein [Candidatus Nitrosocosmicus sp.]